MDPKDKKERKEIYSDDPSWNGIHDFFAQFHEQVLRAGRVIVDDTHKYPEEKKGKK